MYLQIYKSLFYEVRMSLDTFKNISLDQMKVNFINQNEGRLPFFPVTAIEVNDIKK